MDAEDRGDVRWSQRAGIHFGTGSDEYVYRIAKRFFGTAPSNFMWAVEYRLHEGTEWTPLMHTGSWADRPIEEHTLKEAKSKCWYHNAGGLRPQPEKGGH